ncbi:lipopolysaccharide biosynthesis protein [Aliivibrio fischeri]|uniref:Wzz/FepE/Etk N-terminal domain-containing protein n=1 Tax=Aliivibrio fischeri TaxID=668 RepID=UPI0012D8F47B|nr:Wzz/FepE/Etk N-terminal domain-containing protein [Aliivibrio fischeri]MUK29453.1 lipopolysaccharide biosynthesis protein [Aliivibrio fischeri]
MNNQSPQQLQQYPQLLSSQSDEIDLKELFLALWEGKLWIIVLTALFAIGATIFAVNSPNIYESKAVFIVDTDPYGIVEGNGYVVGSQLESKVNAELPFISGKSIKEAIEVLANNSSSNLDKLSFSIDKRTGEISVFQQGLNPEDVYQNILVFSKYVNQAYKQNELVKIASQLTSTKTLLEQNQIEKVQDVLAEKYAQQLYKIAILKNPSTELIYVMQEPVKAASHIKPKRALIVALGALLGGMLGVAIVLVRFAFRKED